MSVAEVKPVEQATLGTSDGGPASPPRSKLRAVLVEMRPRQWTKNAAVLAPILFAHRALDLSAVLLGVAAALSYCLLSSAIYIFNDVVDRDSDRQHPLKRLRPIASGELDTGFAVSVGLGLVVVSLGAFALLGTSVLHAALGYVALQVAYTAVLKRLVIIDVIAIAVGFVVRVASGALVIAVPISNWLYLCTLLLALFLGFSKRRAELVLLERDAGAHRANLSELSLPLLDQLIGIISAATILAYSLYTMSEETVRKVGGDGLKYTIPCVMYGIFRYLYLIHRKKEGGSPEKVLLTDVPLLLSIVTFVGIAAVVLYG